MISARENLLASFPVWLRTAAEVAKVDLGEVIRFSETLLFFPDCNVTLGSDIYVGTDRLDEVQIPLLVNRDHLITDLLANPPGTFAYPGNTTINVVPT